MGEGYLLSLPLFSEEHMTILTGEVSGSVTAKQLPDIRYEVLNIKAEISNSGNIYIGVSGVTLPNGITDITTGYELTSGESIWIVVPGNLNSIWIICDNAGDDLVYLAQQ